jgi:hypothetical protein
MREGGGGRMREGGGGRMREGGGLVDGPDDPLERRLQRAGPHAQDVATSLARVDFGHLAGVNSTTLAGVSWLEDHHINVHSSLLRIKTLRVWHGATENGP